MEKRCSFELFKSNVCHWLKEEGDIDFLIQVLESDLIRKYYNVSAQKTLSVRKNVRGMNAPIVYKPDIIPTDFFLEFGTSFGLMFFRALRFNVLL